MKSSMIAAVLAIILAGQGSAQEMPQGDAAAGEKVFRKCKSCHGVVDDTGQTIVRGGRVGPNLFGLNARAAGSQSDYSRKYGAALVAAGEAGLVWNEADFVSFVADPRGFLKTYTGDGKAKSKMAFKLPQSEDALDVWAYLVSLGME